MPAIEQKVLIDINALLKPQITGLGVYTGELIRHLASLGSDEFDWGFYYNSRRRNQIHQLACRIPRRLMDSGFQNGLSYNCGIDRELGTLLSRWVDLQSWLQLQSRKWRLFHATNIHLPPLPARVKGIVTIHDVFVSRFPHLTTPYMRRRWTARVTKTLQRASHVIAISKATAADLQEHFSVTPDKIQVIYQGVDDRSVPQMDPAREDEMRRRWDLPERFFLFVGTLTAHKNAANIIRAFGQISDPSVGLVIVGKPGDGWADIQSCLERCPGRPRVKLVGYLDPPDLEAFYQLATAFVFPSLYEGFGLPVLEAMKRGLPVITSDTSSMAELFSGSALLVDPLDTGAIATAMEQLLTNESTRKELIRKGDQMAATLTWRNTAERTRELYKSFF